MKWLIDFLDEQEEMCEWSRKHETDLADRMYTVGQESLIKSLRDLIATKQAPYMSKQDMIDELAIMRDEEKRGK
jgi:hypothetical protein